MTISLFDSIQLLNDFAPGQGYDIMQENADSQTPEQRFNSILAQMNGRGKRGLPAPPVGEAQEPSIESELMNMFGGRKPGGIPAPVYKAGRSSGVTGDFGQQLMAGLFNPIAQNYIGEADPAPQRDYSRPVQEVPGITTPPMAQQAAHRFDPARDIVIGDAVPGAKPDWNDPFANSENIEVFSRGVNPGYEKWQDDEGARMQRVMQMDQVAEALGLGGPKPGQVPAIPESVMEAIQQRGGGINPSTGAFNIDSPRIEKPPYDPLAAPRAKALNEYDEDTDDLIDKYLANKTKRVKFSDGEQVLDGGRARNFRNQIEAGRARVESNFAGQDDPFSQLKSAGLNVDRNTADALYRKWLATRSAR